MSKKRRAAKQSRKQRNQRKKDVAAARTRALLDQARERYATKWSAGHASYFNSRGDYEWMAQSLKGCSHVVEVGTGDGRGTIALYRNGSVVVSIEDNPFCLQLSERMLREAGIPVIAAPRGRIAAASTNSYEIDYGELQVEMPSEGVLLLGGDVANDDDQELEKWLIAHSPFDGIACWNIGTHGRKTKDPPSQYRLNVQNKVYAMAHHILKSGGVLHVVDRGHAPTDEFPLESMIASMLEAHMHQASRTDLQVDPNITHRVYETLADGTGISMQVAEESTLEFDENHMAFWSIVSRKQ